MKRSGFFGFILLTLSLWTGCGSTSDEQIDANEFVEWTKKNEVVVLDVRNREEYATGHWPGATLLDYDGGEFSKRMSDLDPIKTYLIYCRTTRRSSAAARELKALGIKSLVLKDGYAGIHYLRLKN